MAWLYVLWLALIGADRVDLLGGRGGFILTPFLVLTPLVVALGMWQIALRGGHFHRPRYTLAYLLLATSFLAVVLLSVMLGFDVAVGVRRFVLLWADLYGTLAVVLLLANRSRPAPILVGGAYIGLALGFVFNVAQLFFWLAGEWNGAGGALVDLTPRVYGSFAPRLSGQALDMNRGGMLFLVYLFLLVRFAPASRLRTVFLALGGLSLVATLSRSVLLGALAMGALLLIQQRGVHLPPRRVVAGTLFGAGVVLLLLLNPWALRLAGEALEPLSGRFSLREGSAREHLALFARGFDVMGASMKHALIGIGYGNSFAVLQDFFPGNKYGNFHSLYVTFWVEAGPVALALYLALLLFPLVRGGIYWPLMGGLIAFNLFYQTAGNVLWMTVVMAWMNIGSIPVPASSKSEAHEGTAPRLRRAPFERNRRPAIYAQRSA